MTITESNDINTVLHYLYQLPGYTGLPNEQEVQAAAERLADRATKSLGAGLSASHIREAKGQMLRVSKGVA
jgi:hypothetical protein